MTRGRRILRGLQIAGGILAFGLLAHAVRAAVLELRGSALTIDVVGAGLALAVVVTTLLFLTAAWRILFRDLGVALRAGDMIRLWSFSNLGRYLPGKVWQVVGMVVVARDLGVPAGLSAAAALLGFGFMVSSGALVGLLLLGTEVAHLAWIRGTAAVLAAGILVPVIWPGLFNAVFRRLPASFGCTQIPPVSRLAVLRFALLQCIAWLGHGVSFFLLARATADPAWSEFPRFAGAYALAYVAGLVALFAPGGIGVREGALGLLLGEVVGGDLPTHALAVAARLLAIAGEVTVLAIALGIGRRRSREVAP